MNHLQGKVALVTGASRGLGAAIAIELAKQGASLIGTATTDEGAEKITKYFQEQKLSGYGYKMNVRNAEEVENVVDEITKKHGAPVILVNNAGITRDNLLLRMSAEEWDEVIDTNLNSVFRVTKACLKGMLKAKWGRIISISSVAGVAGNPGQCNYAATKAGMIGFSKSLAVEVASRNITVNVVAPGLIDTDMNKAITDKQREMIIERVPLGQLGKPEDIAAAVVYLALPSGDFITGQTLNVNGGMVLI